MTESARLALRRQLHLLCCGGSRAAHRIRWICNNAAELFPNLERVANASPFYDAPALDGARAVRPPAALLETSRRFGNAFLYHRVGHATVTRSARPTLRWQLRLLRCGSSRAGY